MTDYRSDAEKFVTAFLDHFDMFGLNDYYNPQTKEFEPSEQMEMLIEMAEDVFPDRLPGGESADLMFKLDPDVRDELIEEAPNVIDTREMFSRKIAENGGLRAIVTGIVEGDVEAYQAALEFVKAERGEKDFHVPTSE